VTHVEAKSQVRAGHRDAPALRSDLGLTARRCSAVTVDIRGNSSSVGGLCGSRSAVIARLTCENDSGHLLGEVAESRLVPVTILTVIVRRARGLLGGRRALVRETHRSTGNLDG
jgi:hypothetical protein